MALISQLMYQGDEEIRLVSITVQLNPLQGHSDSQEVSWKSTGVLFSRMLCPTTVSEAQTAVGPKSKAVLLMQGMSGSKQAGMCPDSFTSHLQAYKDQKTSPFIRIFLYGPVSSAQAQPAGTRAGNQWPKEQTQDC